MDGLHALLAACLSNDNLVRKPAEESVKALSSSPDVVPALLQQLQHATDAQVRHLAAVLLRKRIGKHWASLNGEVQQGTQAVLLQSMAHEPVHVVRRAVADVAAAVAKQTVPSNQWPELLSTMQQWSEVPSADHRELSLVLFSALAEVIGKHMAPALPALIAIVTKALGDPHQGVRLAALRAVEQLVPLVMDEPHVLAFHALVAKLLESTASAVQGGHEEEVMRCFQLFVDACDATPPLLGPHVPAVVQLACHTAAQPQLELETRDQALQVITALVCRKPKQLTKQKDLLNTVVQTLCRMSCEDSAQGIKAEREVGTKTPRALAGQTLDALALSVQTQHIGPQVLTFARAAVASPSRGERLGALTVVAVLCEGGAVWLRRRMDDVLPLVMAGLQDADGDVRAAAAFAVGQMSEFMPVEVVEHHAQVLPALLTVMAHETDHDLQERACYAIDTFCEALEPQEIAPYMAQVMEQLVRVLTHGAHASHAGIQEVALSAMASIAAASGKAFLPHLPTLLPVLSHFMSGTATDYLACRCRATEVMGVMMEHLGAVPESGLAAMLPGVVEVSLGGWPLGFSELREYTHGLWASCAKGVGAPFGAYLPQLVPLAFASLDQDEGDLLVDGAGDSDEEEQQQGGDSDEEEQQQGGGGGAGASNGGAGPAAAVQQPSDEDEEDEAALRQVHVRSGVLDEKCAALQALGLYAAHCGGAPFLPFLEESLKRAIHLANEAWHEELQIQACEALPRLVACTHACFPPAAPGAAPSAPVQQAVQAACPALLESLGSPDKSVVCAALAGWKELLALLGAAPLGAWLQQVSDQVTAVLQDKAPCCEYEDDEDEEGGGDEEQGGDAAEELLAAAADLLPVMAGAAGAAAYAPVLASAHLPALLGRLGASQPEGIRGVALGALAEVSERMQGHMVPHLRKLVPVLLKELRASDAINRQNAAFCVGVLVEGCGPEAVGPFVQQLLHALQPLFSSKEAPGTRDNAVGCVARMVLCAPVEAPIVPLDAVLPAVCSALPPQEDWAEAGPTYRALCQVLSASDAALAKVAAHVPAIVKALGEAVVASQLPDATRKLIRETVQHLRTRHAAQLDPLLAALPAEQKQALLSQ